MGGLLSREPVGGYLSGAAWHSHEMLLGFAPAVIAGFLLTAVRNWTGRPTASGAAAGALWSLAFVVFLARYGAILIRPRIDGRPG